MDFKFLSVIFFLTIFFLLFSCLIAVGGLLLMLTAVFYFVRMVLKLGVKKPSYIYVPRFVQLFSSELFLHV